MDTKLIQDFCLGFYGYGNLNSEYWFVGMEEGGQNTIKEFYESYVEKWDGKESADFLKDLNKETERMYFSNDAKIQKTWGGIITLLLSIENFPINRESIIEYQKTKLGRINGNNLLIELLPLPHRSISDWDYQSLEIPYFDTRESYCKYYLPKRIEHIKNLLKIHRPKVVVFLGVSEFYLESWKKIIGIEKNDNIIHPYIIRIDTTVFVICKHPAAFGLHSSYYPEIGKSIRDILFDIS
jgi:hypothetical protein